MTALRQFALNWWLRSWFWLVPFLVALVFEGRGIASVGLWSDEIYTANAVKGGFGESNNEPPYLPYYTVVWLLTGLGKCTTETCLRWPSAAAMIATVVIVAVTARILGGKRAGLAAGLLVALSPAAQRFGQDARPFALATLLVSSATLSVVIASRSERRSPWAIYAFLVASTGIVLPPALVMLPAHAVLLWRRPATWALYKRWAVSIAACVPIFVAGALLLNSASSWRGHGDLFVLHYTNAWYAWMSINSGGIADSYAVGELAIAVFLLGIMTRQGSQWLLAAAVAAFCVWLASFGPYSWFMGRFFMPLLGMTAVAASLGLARMTVRRMSLVFAVLIVVLLPAYTANRFPWARGFDFRTAIAQIDSGWQPGDAIDSANDGQFGLAWGYYAADESRTSVPLQGAKRVWFINDARYCPNPIEQWNLGVGNTLTLCSGNEVLPQVSRSEGGGS